VGEGEGEGDGDIKAFASCSPACLAPLSSMEVVLGLCSMSAPTAMHAETKIHARMSALINARTAFIAYDDSHLRPHQAVCQMERPRRDSESKGFSRCRIE
jgi:hypothetical protein